MEDLAPQTRGKSEYFEPVVPSRSMVSDGIEYDSRVAFLLINSQFREHYLRAAVHEGRRQGHSPPSSLDADRSQDYRYRRVSICESLALGRTPEQAWKYLSLDQQGGFSDLKGVLDERVIEVRTIWESMHAGEFPRPVPGFSEQQIGMVMETLKKGDAFGFAFIAAERLFHESYPVQPFRIELDPLDATGSREGRAPLSSLPRRPYEPVFEFGQYAYPVGFAGWVIPRSDVLAYSERVEPLLLDRIRKANEMRMDSSLGNGVRNDPKEMRPDSLLDARNEMLAAEAFVRGYSPAQAVELIVGDRAEWKFRNVRDAVGIHKEADTHGMEPDPRWVRALGDLYRNSTRTVVPDPSLEETGMDLLGQMYREGRPLSEAFEAMERLFSRRVPDAYMHAAREDLKAHGIDVDTYSSPGSFEKCTSDIAVAYALGLSPMGASQSVRYGFALRSPADLEAAKEANQARVAEKEIPREPTPDEVRERRRDLEKEIEQAKALEVKRSRKFGR